MKTDITIPQLKAIFLTKEDFKQRAKKFATKRDLEKFVTKDEFRDAIALVATKRELQETKEEIITTVSTEFSLRLSQFAESFETKIETNMNNIMMHYLDIIAGNAQTAREELGAMKIQTTRHDQEIKFLAKASKIKMPNF